MDAQVSQAPLVYIGTYTANSGSEGIYVYRFDRATGELTFTGHTGKVANPSYLAIHPDGRHLYSVCEVGTFEGKKGGGVSAFRIDRRTGELTLLNQEPSSGGAPCYISLGKRGRHALVANYSAGSVGVLPIREDGTVAPLSHVVQHEGRGANPDRQEGPHAHCIRMDPAGRFVFAVDLGIDKVVIYRLDETTGKLVPNDPPFAQFHPGAGPRHIVFQPDGKQAFVVNELDSTLTRCSYDASTGALKPVQMLTTLPEEFTDNNTGADVHVHPSGRFVYSSNRGHDSIAIFAIDASGALVPVGHESTRGKEPRGFAIDPMGNFLLAANQNTNTVVTFRIDTRTGKLTPTGHQVSVPKPVCIQFAW